MLLTSGVHSAYGLMVQMPAIAFHSTYSSHAHLCPPAYMQDIVEFFDASHFLYIDPTIALI